MVGRRQCRIRPFLPPLGPCLKKEKHLFRWAFSLIQYQYVLHNRDPRHWIQCAPSRYLGIFLGALGAFAALGSSAHSAGANKVGSKPLYWQNFMFGLISCTRAKLRPTMLFPVPSHLEDPALWKICKPAWRKSGTGGGDVRSVCRSDGFHPKFTEAFFFFPWR